MVLLVFSSHLDAEQGVLVIHAGNPQGRAITGVVLATKGDGATGPPTDKSGKSRIRLAPQTRPRSWVSLQVVRSSQDLVFISPWDSRVMVPSFENESENFVPVVLAERGNRALLESGKALASLSAKINFANAAKDANANKTVEQRRAVLEEVSREYGLDPAQVDSAIRALGSKSKDPYERGMAALYQREFPEAARELAGALQSREIKLKKVPGSVLNAALFLGEALYEQGKYADAVKAYQKALAFRPDDPAILTGIGLSLLKAGKPAESEPFLRRALELQEEAIK